MFYTVTSSEVPLKDWQVLCLVVAGPAANLRLVSSEGEAGESPSFGENDQGVGWHPSKLKGKRPIEEHDDHAVDPLKDGGGVLQGEALLAEKNSTWWWEVKEKQHTTPDLMGRTKQIQWVLLIGWTELSVLKCHVNCYLSLCWAYFRSFLRSEWKLAPSESVD